MDGGIMHDPPLCHGAWALGTDVSSLLECAVLLASCWLRAGMGAGLTSIHQKRGAIRNTTDAYDWPKKKLLYLPLVCFVGASYAKHVTCASAVGPRFGQEIAALHRWDG